MISKDVSFTGLQVLQVDFNWCKASGCRLENAGGFKQPSTNVSKRLRVYVEGEGHKVQGRQTSSSLG